MIPAEIIIGSTMALLIILILCKTPPSTKRTMAILNHLEIMPISSAPNMAVTMSSKACAKKEFDKNLPKETIAPISIITMLTMVQTTITMLEMKSDSSM